MVMGLLLPISTFSMTTLCYCDSKLAFARCCEPLLKGKLLAPTAEALMRSRYCAYVLGDFQYILNTYSQAKRRDLSLAVLQQDANETQWLALQVESHQLTEPGATVQFSAFYRYDGQLYKLHELSRFIIEEGHWRYVDGQMLDDCGKLRLGRNDSCFCGSNKKFKQCCGKN
ncbi:YchJ family protein [Bowmanella denitrificans]|uniref:YchJ family protein n=1 Tax=Bowmanella denitrificans TaxID=366582 RepID=UPI00318465E2